MSTYSDIHYERHYHQSVLKYLINSMIYQISDYARYHLEDPIRRIFREILEILISLANEQTILDVLTDINRSDHFSIFANYLNQMNDKYYSPVFFNKVLEIIKKFEKSELNIDVKDAIDGFPREESIEENIFFQSFFKMNVSEMITFINNYDGKFLANIIGEAEHLAKKYQSHKLISTLRKNLFKVEKCSYYDNLVDVLEYAEDILERF